MLDACFRTFFRSVRISVVPWKSLNREPGDAVVKTAATKARNDDICKHQQHAYAGLLLDVDRRLSS